MGGIRNAEDLSNFALKMTSSTFIRGPIGTRIIRTHANVYALLSSYFLQIKDIGYS